MRDHGRCLEIAVIASILVIGGSGAAVAAAGPGVCTTVEVEAPIVLPAAGLHPAGRLTLCVGRELSPVSSLHRTYVNGRPVAMLISRRGVSEANDDDVPFMMFHRDARGRLHLYGYATPAGDRMVTYSLDTTGPLRRAERERSNEGAPPFGAPTMNTVLLTASLAE